MYVLEMPDIGGLVTACRLGMGTVEVDNPFFIIDFKVHYFESV